MAPKFVAPYRKSGKRVKNDAADAAAICEAVTRPNMRFVPVKDVDQQAILCLHRTRQGFVEERTALYNRLRDLISEFCIVLLQKVERLRQEIGAYLEALPGWANRCVGDLPVHADRLNERIDEYDKAIAQAARQDARSRQPMHLYCIGPTTASALWLPALAAVMISKIDGNLLPGSSWCPVNTAVAAKLGWAGSPKREMPIWCSLLVMGARAVFAGLGEKQDRFSRWARSLVERRGYWKAAVAIAAKNLRLSWAVMKYGDDFRLTAATD